VRPDDPTYLPPQPPTPGASEESYSPILAVSDGTGASAEHLVRSMLVQFGDPAVPLIKLPGVSRAEDIELALELACSRRALMIVHTILAPELRAVLQQRCLECGIPQADLVGDMLAHLIANFGAPNSFRPGLYRRLHGEYFQKVEAIDYAISHDDGQGLDTLAAADVILLGVSRTGKTPLCMYLAMQGYKAANVPLVAGITPPRQLEDCDRRRQVGLVINTGLLLEYRTHRQSGLGAMHGLYTDPSRVFHEMETARAFFRRFRLPIIDVTNKPIESSAAEVVSRLAHRVGLENLPGQEL
jgi:[pyruvate, water dikinase]-phosphate phosphotransferase / [pyruvate, water dikinase] kinase